MLKIGEISNPGSEFFRGGGEKINNFFTGRLKCTLSAGKWYSGSSKSSDSCVKI